MVRYSIITEAHYEEVLEFVNEYHYANEPVRNIIKSRENLKVDHLLKDCLMSELKQGMSLMATGVDTGELIGILIVCETTPESRLRLQQAYKSIEDVRPSFSKYNQVLKIVFNESLFEMAQTNTLYDLHIMTVHPKYQRRGIASELMRRAVDQGFRIGFTKQKVYASSQGTFVIALRLGFITHRQVEIKDIVIDGQPLHVNGYGDAKLRVMFK